MLDKIHAAQAVQNLKEIQEQIQLQAESNGEHSSWPEPFGYSLLTYLWVIALATFASCIRYLNKVQQFTFTGFLVEVMSGGFTGLLTFWLCEASSIRGPLSAFLIGVSGLMGSRAWQEVASKLLRFKLGLPFEERGEAIVRVDLNINQKEEKTLVTEEHTIVRGDHDHLEHSEPLEPHVNKEDR